MKMSEVKWKYVGRKRNGKPKFKCYTMEDLDFVKAFLDNKGITYYVHPKVKVVYIYKSKNPDHVKSPRFDYYYTTGVWRSGNASKAYQSKGIEDFIDRFYRHDKE